MNVHVTDQCIKDGVRHDLNRGPVAIAMRNAGARDVIFDEDWSCKFESTVVRRGKLPVAVCRLIEDFWDGKAVSPMSFKMPYS